MAEDKLNSTVQTLLKGMDGFLSAKTVVGEPVHINDTIILPLIDVSFGVAAGSFTNDNKKNNSAGGMSGKMSPSAVIVIQDGNCKLINIKNQDVATKIIDLIPDLVDKFTGKTKSVDVNEEVDKAIDDVKKNS